jgi:hypothetical protein
MSDPEPFNPMNLRLYVILRSDPILGFEVLHCGGNDGHSSSLMPLALDGRARCARQVFRLAVRVVEVLDEGRERDHYSEARELMERLDKKAVEELARKVAMHGPFDIGVDYSSLADVLLHLERTKDSAGAAWKLYDWLTAVILKAPAFFGARRAECEALIGERRMAERVKERASASVPLAPPLAEPAREEGVGGGGVINGPEEATLAADNPRRETTG